LRSKALGVIGVQEDDRKFVALGVHGATELGGLNFLAIEPGAEPDHGFAKVLAGGYSHDSRNGVGHRAFSGHQGSR
jgi:hypothetical protein